jgi:hypothetical protein
MGVEPGPLEDSELEDVVQEFVDALREGGNGTAMNLLDRAIGMAKESGDNATHVRLMAYRSELRGKFISIDFGPDADDGDAREPRRPLPDSDQGSAQQLNEQNGFDPPAP